MWVDSVAIGRRGTQRKPAENQGQIVHVQKVQFSVVYDGLRLAFGPLVRLHCEVSTLFGVNCFGICNSWQSCPTGTEMGHSCFFQRWERVWGSTRPHDASLRPFLCPHSRHLGLLLVLLELNPKIQSSMGQNIRFVRHLPLPPSLLVLLLLHMKISY